MSTDKKAPELQQTFSVLAVPSTTYEKLGFRAELYAILGPFLPANPERIYQPGCEAVGIYRIRDNTGDPLPERTVQGERCDYEKIHGIIAAYRAVDDLATERKKMVDAILKM